MEFGFLVDRQKNLRKRKIRPLKFLWRNEEKGQMCSFPSLLEELLACCGYNERTICVPFLQIENSSAIVVKIEPSLVIKSVRKSRVEFGCTVTLGFPGFWVGRVWFYWVRGKYSSPEFGFKYEFITKAELARQNIHRKAEEENTRDNYSGGLKCQLIFRAPNLLSCFDVSLYLEPG